MKNKGTPYNQFEREINKKYDALLNEYEIKIEKAQDNHKEKVHNNFVTNILVLHRQIQTSLGENSRFIIDLSEALLEDKTKNFESEFNLRFESIKPKNKSVLQNLAELEAANKLFEFLYSKYNSEPEQAISNIKWQGKTELEFVQLVYALHEAGYLNNEKREITTLVKEMAKMFNYQLGEHWQSNLSDNINNRNTDYQPKIFDKLIKGFNDYRDRQIENNKKKKPK